MSMNKRGGFLFLVFIMLVLMGLIIYFLNDYFPEDANTRIELSCPTANLTCPRVNVTCPNQPIQHSVIKEVIYTSNFQEIITGCYIERPFEAVKWDCDKIAKECVSRLHNAGYSCFVRYGKYKHGTKENYRYENHAWGECGKGFIIEFTAGQIVPPWEHWRYTT